MALAIGWVGSMAYSQLSMAFNQRIEKASWNRASHLHKDGLVRFDGSCSLGC
jgi:hypothetical protein